jgi:hypothetical protein
MARARNIKPAFFDNDELADNDPLGRLLFIGLWTIADHNGNLEWRSKRIKKQILAYDDCCVDSLAINLDKSGFVRFYSDGDKIYLNVVNFVKHQNPHKNEKAKGTEIPEYSEQYREVIDLNKLTINRDLSGLELDNSDSNPADSLNLIPDSLNLIPEEKETKSAKADPSLEIFNYWKEVMKKGPNTTPSKKRMDKVKARLKDGYDVDFIKKAIYGCSITPHNNGTDPKGNGQKYDDLELICRYPENLERFAGNAENQRSPSKQGNINDIGDDFSPPSGMEWTHERI